MSLGQAYQAIKHRTSITETEFFDAMKDWNITDVPGGAVMVRNDEVHVASTEKGRWISRRLIRQILGGLLKKYGKATTKVMPDNEPGKAFVKRLGFVQTGPIDYELRDLKHG